MYLKGESPKTSRENIPIYCGLLHICPGNGGDMIGAGLLEECELEGIQRSAKSDWR